MIASRWGVIRTADRLGGGISRVLRVDWQSLRLAALRRGQKQAIGRYPTGDRVSEGLSGKDAMKRKASISHDEAVVAEIRESPEFAAEYLRAALEDDDEPGALLVALRRVAEARGGIAKVAKAAGIERESLYRALSSRGNPRLSTLVAVAKAVGLRLTVEAQ